MSRKSKTTKSDAKPGAVEPAASASDAELDPQELARVRAALATYAQDAAAIELTADAYGLDVSKNGEPSPLEVFVAELYTDPEQQRVLRDLLSRALPLLASAHARRHGPREVHQLAVVLLMTFAAEKGHRGRAFRLETALEVLDDQAKKQGDPHAFAHLANTDADMSSAHELSVELQRRASAILGRLEGSFRLHPRPERTAEDEDALQRLAEDGRSLSGLARAMWGIPPSGPPERDGMLAWDAELADELDGLDADGRAYADKLRVKARERWAQREALPPATLWRLWIHEQAATPGGDDQPIPEQFAPQGFRTLARAIWRDVVGPRLERERGASQGVRAKLVRVEGDRYTRVPKIVAPLSWAFGAPGSAVDVDGDHYAKAPGVAAELAAPRVPRKVVPRTFALLPKDWTRPHQGTLALGTDESDDAGPAALPVAIATATQYAISPVQAKVSLVAFADPLVRKGQLVGTDLGELTRIIFEGNKRIQSRELEATAAAVRGLRSLLVYLPDDTTVPLFDTRAPAANVTARADMPIMFGLSRTFLAVLGQEEVTSLGGSYRGEFLFNMSGAMRLPNKRPALLRHYTRAASHWNAAFDPQTKAFSAFRLPTYTWREWAILTNALPPSVVEYLRDRKGPAARRFELSKAVAEVRTYLEELAEEHDLIRIERVGRDGFRPLPTPAWLEAKEKVQAGGARSEPL